MDIFEFVSLSTMSWKYPDDISNGSGVISLTDKQTNTQTDTSENNTTLGGMEG